VCSCAVVTCDKKFKMAHSKRAALQADGVMLGDVCEDGVRTVAITCDMRGVSCTADQFVLIVA